ncbi:Transcription initiation factor IIF subunit alpha [Smittium mucronatum]|uniref:Transcription initiation factor IIF subunit alpha n=1 Tax=Smittium mucronatum TaxID=133383 RepID=A0A1R0GV45_9FUNG|nr:Transcription initiation factor IIF subunit alpha [Smittium mucronatum]
MVWIFNRIYSPEDADSKSPNPNVSLSEKARNTAALAKGAVPKGVKLDLAQKAEIAKKMTLSQKSEVQKETRTFTDYRLVSSIPEKTNNVMRFQSSNVVDPKEFMQPVKLRRKERYQYNRNRDANKGNSEEGFSQENSGEAITSTSQDETEAKQSFGSPSGISKTDPSIISPYGGGARNKQLMFKKRTKQVFFADEKQRKLNIEESRPWILEDFDGAQNWTGTLEGGQKSNYVLFVLMDDGFKVVPVDRWYKFSSKLKYSTLTLDEAEIELKKSQKTEVHDRWLMKKRAKQLEETKNGENGTDNSVISNISSILNKKSSGESENKPKLVEYEDENEEDEDGEDIKGKRKRNLRGDADEVDFEDEFADDEEMAEDLFDGAEEEAEKEAPGNKTNALGGSDEEEEEEEDETKLDYAGKEMKDLMKKIEKNKAYDSENEDNPYVSELSDQSDEDEDKKQEVNKDDPNAAKTGSEIPETSNVGQGSMDKGQDVKPSISELNSGVGMSKSTSNSSSIIKKRKRNLNEPQDSISSEVGTKKANQNNNADDYSKSQQVRGVQPAAEGTDGVDPSLITEQEVIDLIKVGNLTTKDLIAKVKRKLKENPLNRPRISDIVKRVATIRDGILVLKISK